MINIVFIIGPQRTGTSWIFEQLRSQKEGIHLDLIGLENEFFFKKHAADIGRSKFLKKLSGKSEAVLYADVCSLYFGHIEPIENILACFPEAKFVFIRRDEEGRKKSFDEHRHFNRFSSSILGYNISEELYETQSNFDNYKNEIFKIAGESNCLQLEFDDLKNTNGQKWIEELSQFTNTDLSFFDKGIVNASKKDSSLTKRILFIFVRLLQKLKVQNIIRKIKILLNKH